MSRLVLALALLMLGMNPWRSGYVPDRQPAPLPTPQAGAGLAGHGAVALSGYSSDHRPVVASVHGHRIITYNAGNASDAKVRADLLRLTAMRPAVIGLQEVSDRTQVLRSIPGYRLIQLHHAPASAHVALLVRGDLHVTDVALTPISPRTYVGNNVAGAAHHGGHAEAKYVLSANVDGHTYGVVHLVPSVSRPGNWRARQLYARQVAGIMRWWHAHHPAVLMGDFNAAAGYRLLAPLRAHAHAHYAPSHGPRPIDIVWTHGG